jgi:hypothetical protein
MPPGWARRPLPQAWRRIGRTDATGTSFVGVPAEVADGEVRSHLSLLVRAEGHAWVHAGVQAFGPPYLGSASQKVPDDQSLPVRLPRRARLLLEGADERQWLLCTYVAALPGRIAHSLQVRPAGGRADLPFDLDSIGTPAPNLLPGGVLVGRPTARETACLCTIAYRDAAGLRAQTAGRKVTVRGADPAGAPLRGALVAIRATRITAPDLPLFLDDDGRGEVRLGAGEWLLLARARDAVAWRAVREAERDVAWTFTLAPMARATVRALDAGLRPLAHERVTLSFSFRRPRGGPRVDRVQELVDQWLLSLLPPRTRYTDGDGELTVALPPLEGWIPECCARIGPAGDERGGGESRADLGAGAKVDLVVR